MIKSITFKTGSLGDLVHVLHPSLWHLNCVDAVERLEFEFCNGAGTVAGEFVLAPDERPKEADTALLPYVALSVFTSFWPPTGFIHEAQEPMFGNWQYTFWTMPEDLHKMAKAGWLWKDFYREVMTRLKVPEVEAREWLSDLNTEEVFL